MTNACGLILSPFSDIHCCFCSVTPPQRLASVESLRQFLQVLNSIELGADSLQRLSLFQLALNEVLYIFHSHHPDELLMFLAWQELRETICGHSRRWNPFDADSAFADLLSQPVPMNIDVMKLRIDFGVL